MLHLAIYLIYATTFGTLLSELVQVEWGWGVIAASFVWLGGVIVSFIPMLRTIVLAVALCYLMPWWAAIPSACVINFVRFILVVITDPKRKETLRAQQEENSRIAQEIIDQR